MKIKEENGAFKLSVQKNQLYVWCSCGLSKKDPLCDGAHKSDDKGRKPVRYIAESDKTVLFCMCKKTSTPPFCDGSHLSSS